MTTIQLHISDDIAGQLSNLTVNVESFILDLLHNKLKELDKTELLAKEYRMASIENKSLLQDFTTVDLENWEDEY